jgi:hypothetical protein
MSNLLHRVLERIRSNMGESDYQPNPNYAVTLTKVQEIEEELDCKLPDLLREMYLKIGSDGLEQIGLLSLEDLFTVHARKGRSYLQALGGDSVGLTYLVIRDWGCSYYSCVNISNPLCPVLVYVAVAGFFIPEKPSLGEWISALLDRENPWDTVLEQEEKFTNIVTVSQSLNVPLLLVLREWIDELLPGR